MHNIIHIGWLLTALLAWNFFSPIGSHCFRRNAGVRKCAIRNFLVPRVTPRLQRPNDKADEAPPVVAEPVTVTDADFEQVVLRSPIPVLVVFGAVWCPPCRALAPTIDELAKEYQGRPGAGTGARSEAQERTYTGVGFIVGTLRRDARRSEYA